MKKKFYSLIAAALIFSMVAGCGSTVNSETTTPGSNSNAVNEPAENTAVVSEPDTDSSLEQGAVEDEKSTKLSDELVTLTCWKMWPPFLSNFDPSDAYEFRYMEELLNVKVDVHTVSTDTASEQFNLMVASEDMTDFIESATSYYSGGGTKAIENGILLDLAPYLEEYAPDYYELMSNDSYGKRASYDSDGQVSQFFGFYDNPMIIANGLWVRQDWLDEQGLQQPSTLDELENVLAVFKSVYNPKDTYAMRSSCEALITNAFDAHTDWYVKDGTVTYGKAETQYKNYLAEIHDWYEKGYFSSDFINANDSTAPLSSLVLSGDSGIVSADKTLISDVYAGDPTGSVDMEPIAPITKNADDTINNQYISTRMLVSSTLSISTNCDCPEIAVGFMNACYKEENKLILSYGEEGVTFEYDEDGNPQYTDLVLNNPDIPGAFATLVYIAPGIPGLRDLALYNSTYTYPAQQICDDIFTSKDNGNDATIFPGDYLTYTSEEADIISEYESDLDTYLDEAVAQFVTGVRSLDDFSAFVDDLNSYGIQELQEVYQAAYDRFNQNA